MLIGLDFSGHGHGHQCTAMIAIVKRDDSRASGGVTSNFDSVFNGLCAAIKENRLLCEIARGQLHDAFSKSNIWFVHHDAEACMREFRGLLCNGFRYFWASMPNIHGSKATGKVDVAVSIYIFDNSAISFGSKYIHRR